MAIHQEQNSTMEQGLVKTIDFSGMALMFDALQKHQYSFPVKSTVRELLSNGIDSVVERDSARKILTGQAEVSEFYVEKEGDAYKDSKWDPTYYSTKWLSTDPYVRIMYMAGAGSEKDTVVFEDNGVGLGGKRLGGYFRLGWSSKRLSKLPLGKFGLGAKSALSLGMEFFTLVSRHNGKQFKFNVYSYKVDSLVPKMNLVTGKENPYIILDEGTENEYKVHYEPTEQLNGCTVTVNAKKHHKQQYIDAVKSQLLYFPNIKLTVHENGNVQEVEYKANILYQDEHIVLSDNKYYDKPHILLNGVNYGFVNFEELELEEKQGNIGIKMTPEQVDINPSRESIIWSDNTKEIVLEKFRDVQGIAARMIQKELLETDYVKWLKLCESLSTRYHRDSSSNNIIGRLSKIVDISRVAPKYSADPSFAFDNYSLFPGLRTRIVNRKEYTARKNRRYWVPADGLERIETPQPSLARPIFLIGRDEHVSIRKDKYLLVQYPQGFTYIEEPYETVEQMVEAKVSEVWLGHLSVISSKPSERLKLWALLSASTETSWYKDVEVPDGFKATDTEISEEPEEDATEEAKEAAALKLLTNEERRKMEGKVLLYTPSPDFRHVTNTNPITKDVDTYWQCFNMEKVEIPIADINLWDEEVYYGNLEDTSLMHLIAMLTRPLDSELNTPSNSRPYSDDYKTWREKKWFRLNKDRYADLILDEGGQWLHEYGFGLHYFLDTKIRLIRVNKASNRLYRDFYRPEQFFLRVENHKITMSNLLIKWNTARLINEQMDKVKFLNNFAQFNPRIAAKYQALKSYVGAHYRDVKRSVSSNYLGLDQQIYTDLIIHLDKVKHFQQFVQESSANAQGIAEMAQALFSNPEIQDGMAVEPQYMQLLSEVLEYGIATGPMFNYIGLLVDGGGPIPDELREQLLQYLDFKGIGEYDVPPDNSIRNYPLTEQEAFEENVAVREAAEI